MNRLVLLLMLPLAGWVAVDETQISPGVFDIVTSANGGINSEGRARVILDQRAQDLCPNGYERHNERLIQDQQDRKTMTWRIVCTS